MKRAKAIIGLIFVISLLIFSSYVGELRAASPITGKTPEKHHSDLVVEKVWLDAQCQINFLLKNAGKGSISVSEHSQGMVRVYFGKEQEDFYFTKNSPKGKPPVDPGGALKAAGGSVSYDTKIKLDSSLSVSISVNEDKKITESNYENNKTSPKTLTSACLSKADPSKKPSGRGVPIGIERGINVTLIPSKGNYMPGEALTVRYRFRNPDIPDPLNTTIYLHQQGQGFDQMWKWSELWNIAVGRATIASGEVSVPITVPSGMEQGRPHVITIVKSSEIWGESDRFIIGHIADSGGSGTGGQEIQILSPLAGDIWRRGGERLIKWRTPFPISPSISIMKGDRGVFGPRGGRVVYEPGSKTYSYRVSIPRDLEPGNDYKVRIVDSRNTSVHNESANFTITDQDLNLKVGDIRANTIGHLIVTAHVNGTFSGAVTFRVARVQWIETDRSTRRGENRHLETWEVSVPHIRTGTNEVNLGGARSTGTGCGERYEVKIDSLDRFDEINEDDNTLVKEVYFRPEAGTIEIKRGGDRVLHHNDTISVPTRTRPTFSVWFRNCGNSRARGDIEIRQIGRWETWHGGELRPRMEDHDILLGTRRLDLDSGATDYATMNERDPEAQTSTIEIRLTGDIARWAPANPMIIRVRRLE